MKPVITIDGPAASGKSSVSRALAEKLGWNWVSTGIFYRGLAFLAMELKANVDDEQSILQLLTRQKWSIEMTREETQFVFNGKVVTDRLNQEQIGIIASKVSGFPEVRKALLQPQRDCLKRSHNGLVAEGRDCGTVVFPTAQIKFYLTAASTDRAIRRAKEEGKSVEETKTMQKERDTKDKSREVAPLQVPEGSHVIDTTGMSLSEVIDKVYGLVKSSL